MLREIYESENHKQEHSEEKRPAFLDFLDKLDVIKKNSKRMRFFYDWVVGIDLFGDELGYPYCPFVARQFTSYIIERRTENPCFGVRIHRGENVPFADVNTSVYRLFIAHMYIVFRCLSFLKRKLQSGMGIGHCIAFERILDTSMSQLRHRKSTVILTEMRHYAQRLFETITFEVNITRNEYLLEDTLLQGDLAQTLRLDALFALGTPIILATDDGGIGAIDQCSFVHPGCRVLLSDFILSC